jgi:PAS domain S-box-containing protein
LTWKSLARGIAFAARRAAPEGGRSMGETAKNSRSRTGSPIGRRVAMIGALSLIPLALLAFLSVRLASSALEREVEARVQATAEASAVAIDKEMQGLLELVSSYARRPTLIAALDARERASHQRAHIAFHLRELQKGRPGIATTFAADPGGRLIDIVPKTPAIVGKDFSFRDWYSGVTRVGSPYLSEAYESLARGHPRVVAAATLVRTPGSGRTVGVLVAAYGLKEIQRFVDRFASSQGVKLTVTDQRGVVIAAPGALPAGLTSRRNDPLVAASLRGAAGVASRDGAEGRLLTAYVPVEGLGWAVTASVPEEIAFAPIGRLRSTVLSIGGLLGLVFVAGLVLLALTLRARRHAEQEAGRAREEADQANALNAQLAAIVRSSDDAILSVTLDGIVTSWNPGAERLYGYTAAEMIGQPIANLIPAHRVGEEWSILQDILSDGTRTRYETERTRKDGTMLQVSLTVSPIKNRDGEIVAASSIARDITDQKRAEESVRRARAEAERANRAKSEFLSRMSHELRTPLNAILGFGQLLAMDGLDSNQREGVQQILKAGDHLLQLINEVLDISRIEAGGLSLSVEPVAVAEAVGEALDLVRPLAAERNVVLSGGAASARESVQADRQRLKQVLLNLLANAVKYNRDGGTVRIDVTRVGEECVRISVADTGPGISRESLERLFSPFERLGADQLYVEGTGLGLALSKGLVEAMGGRLGVDSRVGEGSTFWVELPVAERQGERLDDELPAQRHAEDESAPERTVLYIEDNLSNLKLVEGVLSRRPSISLIPAMQGGLGLELAREHPCDLILLDLHLPDLPGSEVLARLLANPATSEIPVVVLSADATPGQVERMLDQGAREYLTKPLDVQRLLEVLDELLFSAAGTATAR